MIYKLFNVLIGLLCAYLPAQSVRITNNGPLDYKGYVRVEMQQDPPFLAGFTQLNCGICNTVNPVSFVATINESQTYDLDVDCLIPANSSVVVDLSIFTNCIRPLPWLIDDPEPLWGGMPAINGEPMIWNLIGISGAGYRVRCFALVDDIFGVSLDFIYRPTTMSVIYGDARITAHGYGDPGTTYTAPQGLFLSWGYSSQSIAQMGAQFTQDQTVIVPFTMIWPNIMSQPHEFPSSQIIRNRQITAVEL